MKPLVVYKGTTSFPSFFPLSLFYAACFIDPVPHLLNDFFFPLKSDRRWGLVPLFYYPPFSLAHRLHPVCNTHFMTFPLAICVKVEEFSKDIFISTSHISVDQKQANLIMTCRHSTNTADTLLSFGPMHSSRAFTGGRTTEVPNLRTVP